MWPWKRAVPEQDVIRELRHRVEDLEREVRGLKAEWLDQYDKLTRRDERLRKRQERENTPGHTEDTPQGQKAQLRARAFALRGSNGHP